MVKRAPSFWVGLFAASAAMAAMGCDGRHPQDAGVDMLPDAEVVVGGTVNLYVVDRCSETTDSSCQTDVFIIDDASLVSESKQRAFELTALSDSSVEVRALAPGVSSLNLVFEGGQEMFRDIVATELGSVAARTYCDGLEMTSVPIGGEFGVTYEMFGTNGARLIGRLPQPPLTMGGATVVEFGETYVAFTAPEEPGAIELSAVNGLLATIQVYDPASGEVVLALDDDAVVHSSPDTKSLRVDLLVPEVLQRCGPLGDKTVTTETPDICTFDLDELSDSSDISDVFALTVHGPGTCRVHASLPDIGLEATTEFEFTAAF